MPLQGMGLIFGRQAGAGIDKRGLLYYIRRANSLVSPGVPAFRQRWWRRPTLGCTMRKVESSSIFAGYALCSGIRRVLPWKKQKGEGQRRLPKPLGYLSEYARLYSRSAFFRRGRWLGGIVCEGVSSQRGCSGVTVRLAARIFAVRLFCAGVCVVITRRKCTQVLQSSFYELVSTARVLLGCRESLEPQAK